MKEIIEFKNSVDEYVSFLNFDSNKTSSKVDRDKRKRTALIYGYGLEGKLYSKEEISIILNITEERVRQINKESISDLKKRIFSSDNDLRFDDDQEIINLYNSFTKYDVLSYNSVLNDISKEAKIEKHQIEPYFNLLIDVFSFRKRKTNQHHLRDNDLIFTSNKYEPKEFIKLCLTIYLIIEKNVLPIDENDLLLSYKKLNKKSVFHKDDIKSAAQVLDSVAYNSESKEYAISFEKISTSNDMAYRVLFARGERMKLAEIYKEIAFRLVNTKRLVPTKSSLNSQMNMDSRLIPLGKSGIWSLKEWNDANKTMYELISDTLTYFNKPLTKSEIFNHIKKSRPKIPTRSLDTVIYNERFLKIEGDKFILKEWKELFKGKIVITKPRNTVKKKNPKTQQIKDQVINLFQESNAKTILLSAIVKTLHKNYKFPKASTYKVIAEDADFETKQISLNKKEVLYKGDNNEKGDIQTKSISVFVSYSWDNQVHQEKVISFVDFLRKQGFEADLDIRIMQEESSADFNRLMHKGILHYDKVVVILSSKYKEKAEKFDGGVGKEYRYIQNDIEKKPKKYVFASLESLNKKVIENITPIDFLGREIIDLEQDEVEGFEKLFSKLTNKEIYKFSDVAKNTPIIQQKKIEDFSLKK